MCDVPSIAVFCSESIECFPGTVSKIFLKLIIIIIIIITFFENRAVYQKIWKNILESGRPQKTI